MKAALPQSNTAFLAAAMAAAVGYIFSSDGAFISALRDKFQQIADDISGAGKNVSIK